MKIEGIGGVMAHRIREVSTAKYVSATPSEIKSLAVKDSLETFNDVGVATTVAVTPPAKKEDDTAMKKKEAAPEFKLEEKSSENSKRAEDSRRIKNSSVEDIYSYLDIPPPPSDD